MFSPNLNSVDRSHARSTCQLLNFTRRTDQHKWDIGVTGSVIYTMRERAEKAVSALACPSRRTANRTIRKNRMVKWKCDRISGISCGKWGENASVANEQYDAGININGVANNINTNCRPLGSYSWWNKQKSAGPIRREMSRTRIVTTWLHFSYNL